MFGLKPISRYQFGLFRLLLGLYLVWHFARLIPFGAEVFSHTGVLSDPSLNFTFGLFPNPLYVWDSPSAVTAILVILLIAGIFFTLGIGRRLAAVVLWFGWASLFHRNNLISNPSLPYVGLLLLSTLLVPTGEAFVALKRKPPKEEWFFPAAVYWVAWVLMAVGYSYSGWIKLASPSWIDGSAFLHVLDNPLARPNFLRDLLLAMPLWTLKLATWGALAIELLAVPLSFTRRTRALLWTLTVGLQLGILSVVNFADLTGGMLLLHLFVLDPEWLPARRPQEGRNLVLYDGVCGLCDRTVQFLLEEDRAQVLCFASLQSEPAAEVMERLELSADLDTLLFIEEHGAPKEHANWRSTGVLRILATIGGCWRVVSWLRIVPRPLRDPVYDFLAAHRYQWFGKFETCKLPSPEVRERFLD
jgi:predicted DCC family thiol-disulfide oxidoreductase YuxK